MRIIVSLLNEGQLLSLGLIQAPLDGVSLLQLLESEHEQFCVMLVRQWTTTNISSRDMPQETRPYGKGIGANFRLSSQWTVAVYIATASSALIYGPSFR